MLGWIPNRGGPGLSKGLTKRRQEVCVRQDHVHGAAAVRHHWRVNFDQPEGSVGGGTQTIRMQSPHWLLLKLCVQSVANGGRVILAVRNQHRPEARLAVFATSEWGEEESSLAATWGPMVW